MSFSKHTIKELQDMYENQQAAVTYCDQRLVSEPHNTGVQVVRTISAELADRLAQELRGRGIDPGSHAGG